ncbi:GlsB/YeaQ/YmgE family stress response membrane protein [Paenibacillus sp. J2TS4]|uniref:GlsB/YeaQ/YmgE family stress response membrane protein n=1 Tax=Paenibacillus sp. J2TS4 TaxID=2807194 RepID=UPI001B01533F|nr:GlsB/YeaQ/YmgE family stress response membrane protein [Paenibacillus sp. J2TS4]GIP34068.1 hypothetical protein J2TS4_32780 [Paenibacillus sp. J2TS4]
MTILLVLLGVALIIGSGGHWIAKQEIPGGIAATMVIAFAGAWLGYFMAGDWGPTLFRFPVVPALLGAALFLAIFIVLSKITNRSS